MLPAGANGGAFVERQKGTPQQGYEAWCVLQRPGAGAFE